MEGEHTGGWRRPRRALALFAMAAVAACSRGEKKPPPRPPAQVTVEPAQARAVPVELTAVGTVVPVSTIVVRSHVSGTLDRVLFQEGQEVHRGDILFQIDPRPFQAVLAQARATLARDEAQLRNARLDLARYQRLAPKGIVSQSDVDLRTAQTRALEAAIAADRAAIQSASVNLEYTTIRSPIDGRTGNLQVNAGNLVKADDTTPLVTVRQLRPIDVGFSIPAPSLAEVRRRAAETSGLSVRATASGEPRPEEGQLFFIDNTVDAATGTVLLKARFPNDDDALWPGEFVDVHLVLRTLPDAVVVPARAIQPSQQGEQLFVVKDGKADLRRVETGPRQGDWIVVTRGVARGEQVVVDGLLGLVPGAPVQARAAQQPPQNGPQGAATASDGRGEGHAQGRRP